MHVVDATSRLLGDPQFKRFTSALETALALFDTLHEWPDIIGFLSKITRILSSFSQFPVVPRKTLVAKRLAQCLNPALPSGVHTKTLEVYGLIFQIAGQSQLAMDLPLWSYGLFPFLQHASTSVKPLLLGLYKEHYLPLGLQLKPCLKGLVLGLLPGLDEQNEYFETVYEMLNALAERVGHGYFYHCLWLAIVTAPHGRHAALVYLLQKLSKNGSTVEGAFLYSLLKKVDLSVSDMGVMLGPDPHLFLRAIAVCLREHKVLVQRNALELLSSYMPLHTAYVYYRLSDAQLAHD